MFLAKYTLMVVLVLVSVAFFTLMERKVLGYSHNRFGPNKVFFLGVFQPFVDAIKLFSKSDVKLNEVMAFFYVVSPILGIFLMLIIWGLFPFYGLILFSNLSFLAFIVMSSLSVYFLLFSGWSSNTKYSLLGGYRSSAQSVSYEVVMVLSFLFICFLWFSLNISFKSGCGLILPLMCFGVLFSWFLSCLAESNRSPFDFSEGESELVSGFNTEYFGGLFSLIFISEYGSILFLSFLSGVLFLGFSQSFFLFCMIFSVLYLWVRSTFPRLRYDFMMMMSWKGLCIYLLGPLFFLF